MLNKTVNLCEISKDGLTPYEVCVAKWNIETLKALIHVIDKGDAEDADRFGAENRDNFFSVNVLKKGLLLAIEEGNFIEAKDLSLLDVIINQIKIQYVVDTSKKIKVLFVFKFKIFLFYLKQNNLIKLISKWIYYKRSQ